MRTPAAEVERGNAQQLSHWKQVTVAGYVIPCDSPLSSENCHTSEWLLESGETLWGLMINKKGRAWLTWARSRGESCFRKKSNRTTGQQLACYSWLFKLHLIIISYIIPCAKLVLDRGREMAANKCLHGTKCPHPQGIFSGQLIFLNKQITGSRMRDTI